MPTRPSSPTPLTVQVTGPDPTDEPIVYPTAEPKTVAVVPGRMKYVPFLPAPLPSVPPDKVDQANGWVKKA